jgi:hypothetical protein
MSTSALLQLPQAQLGGTLPLAYGYVRARGNNIILQELSDKSKVAFFILAEGVWDGIERLWINKKLVDFTDTSIVHFHNGFDGTLGAGLAPSSNGGDQGVDNFFSSLPANYQRLTYSRKAYLAVKVAPDPFAPGPDLDVIGDYRANRVRIFDASGAQTSYAFTTNPVWQMVDLILRKMVKREWLTASAAAAGGDLTAFEKSRFDWASIADTAVNWCDAAIPSGAKRWESSAAFPQRASLATALDQIRTMSQTYVVDAGGKIYIYGDRPRATTFILNSDHISAGGFQAQKSQLRGAQNRFNARMNDLNAQRACDIDTPGNSGLVRNGNRTTVKAPAGKTHPFLVGDQVQIVGATDASFNGTIPVDTIIDSRTFAGPQTGANATSGNGYCGTPESRFAPRVKVIDHENHQKAIGQRGLNLTPTYKRLPVDIDLGNNVMERAERVLKFLRDRNLGADVSPYKAPFEVRMRCHMNAANRNLVPDPDAVGTGWTFSGGGVMTIQQGEGAVHGNGFSYVGNGGASGFLFYYSPIITVVPGATYVISGYIDARFVTGANLPGWLVFDPTITTGYAGANAQAGTNGRVSIAFTVPAGVTQVRVLCDTGNATVANAQELIFSNPQLEPGSVATPYGIGGALLAQLPGDIVYIDSSISEQHKGDYEIVETQEMLPEIDAAAIGDGSQSSGEALIELSLKQYLPSAFSDIADTEQPLVPSISRGGLTLPVPLNATYRPLTDPLTASDAGSTDTISIAAFTMRVNGKDLSVNSGSIVSLSRSTLYFVYYDDLPQLGGAVTFNATTTKEVALQTVGRFFVGSILTPKAASDATIGNNDGGVGAQHGNLYRVLPTLAKDTVNADPNFVPIRNTFGQGADADGDLTTFVLYQGTPGTRIVTGFPTVIINWTSLKLKIKTQVVQAGTQPLDLSYSLDNGATFTNIYTVAAFGTRATTVDVINLSITQNPALVQVKYNMNGNGTWDLYETWIEGQT